MSTLRAAIELKGVFDQLAAAEKAGNLSPDEKQKLEEQAAEKGIQALLKVCQVWIKCVVVLWSNQSHREPNLKLRVSFERRATACLRILR